MLDRYNTDFCTGFNARIHAVPGNQPATREAAYLDGWYIANTLILEDALACHGTDKQPMPPAVITEKDVAAIKLDAAS